jgi:hypothetical protein
MLTGNRVSRPEFRSGLKTSATEMMRLMSALQKVDKTLDNANAWWLFSKIDSFASGAR